MERFYNNITGPDEEEFGSPKPLTALPGSSLFEIAFRNRWLILACTVSMLALGITYLRFSTPIFTSTSLVYVEQKGPKIVDENTGVMTQSKNYLYTQVELIRSTPVLVEVLNSPGIKEMKTLETIEGPLVDFLKKNLDITVGKKDDLINVSFDSPYPEEAAQLVNSVVDKYITYSSKEKQGTTLDVLELLQKDNIRRENELAEKLEEMSKFRQEHIVAVRGSYDTRYVLERINQLQLQLTNLYATHLTDKHPSVIATKKKIEQLKQQNESDAQYSILQTECEQIRKRCDILDDRIKELSTIENAGALNISIVEVARIPEKPSKPQKSRVLAITLVLGLMLGGGLALLRSTMDHKIHSVEEINAIFDIPVLGSVPSMPKKDTLSGRGQKVHLESDSFVAEAYRTIRTSIFFRAPGDRAQTILITSPAMGEGKTTLASNLAIAMAQADQKTLILDADLRKHNQHNIFQTSNEVGLSSVLAGKISLEKAIQSTRVERLDLLATGPVVQSPAELLNSTRFAQLLKDLSARYDRIVIDSPPVMSVTDSHILATLCDITLLVLRIESSTHKSSQHACETLLSVGANLFGVVANDVSKRSRGYAYGYGYVYGNHASVMKDQKVELLLGGRKRGKPGIKITEQAKVATNKTREQVGKQRLL